MSNSLIQTNINEAGESRGRNPTASIPIAYSRAHRSRWNVRLLSNSDSRDFRCEGSTR